MFVALMGGMLFKVLFFYSFWITCLSYLIEVIF